MYRNSSPVKYSHGLAKSLKPLYSEQQNMLLGAVSEFASAEITPYAADVDESREFPFSQLAGLAGLGVTGLTLDEAYGGAGGGYRDMMVVVEEVAAACGSTSTVFVTHVSLGSQPINQVGNDAQKRRWIPDLASGKRVAAFALTEPQSGSDASDSSRPPFPMVTTLS